MKDTNGKCVIDSANPAGAYGNVDAANKLANIVTSVSVNVASMVRNLFDTLSEAVYIAYNTNTRKMKASASNLMAGALGGVSGMEYVTFKPSAGQSGRSLEWQIIDDTTQAGRGDEYQNLLTPVVPRFTAESLVQNLARVTPDGQDAIIVVDQDNGLVRAYVHSNFSALNTAFESTAPSTEPDGVAAHLENVSGSSGPANLVFEGGITPS